MTSGIGIEQMVAAAWLDSTLGGDTDLQGDAPGGVVDGPGTAVQARPLVRFTMQSAITARGVGFTEIMVNMLWVVRAVCEGASYVPLMAAGSRIQSLLHGVQDVPVNEPTGVIVTSSRSDPYRLQGVEGGREWRELGGIYRIYVQGS